MFKLRQGGIYLYNIINKTNRKTELGDPLTELWNVLLLI